MRQSIHNRVNRKMDNMTPVTKIIGLAAKASGILALPILIIGGFYWVFSPGSFDKIWEKLNQVSSTHTFILLFLIIISFVGLVFGLAYLWYSLENKKLAQANTPSLISSDSNESQKKTPRNPRKKS